MRTTDTERIICSMVRVGKSYGQNKVLDEVSLSYFYGAKIGILGLNGSGKSSFLKIMAGLDLEFTGEVTLASGFTVGYLAQEPDLDPERTVFETVREGAGEVIGLLAEFEKINEQFGDPMSDSDMEKLLERQGVVQSSIESLGGWELESRLELSLDALRCPPGETKIGVLSGGERRRVALCRLLLEKPDILLLDEPTNHLDAETVAWLEHHLKQYEGTIIAVTHDRYFLDNVAGWILELDRGKGIPFRGNYSSWLEQKQERLRHEEKGESARRRTLSRELEWIRMSPKARHAKGKARIQAYDKLVSASAGQMERDVALAFPPAPRLGTLVVDVNGVSKSFGDRLLISNAEFSIPPGAVVGVIGPNGAGKTTLFKMITGEEIPDSGSVRVGETVLLGYAEQHRDALVPGKTIFETISAGQEFLQIGSSKINSRAYVAQFNLSGQDQQKKVDVLSGGERNRVHLALMLKAGANLLLLDEPTNDLDVNTTRSLEEAIERFGGCVIAISHDRWFLDRISTHILAFEGESQIHWFEGNYSEYEEERRRRLGDAALVPHRIKYRPLTRE